MGVSLALDRCWQFFEMIQAEIDKISLNSVKTINAKTKSDRVTEGGAILRGMFARTESVALAA